MTSSPERSPERSRQPSHVSEPGASTQGRSRARQGAGRVADKLRQRGFQAYFVGGCVRDLLRGVEPKDYDVATDARPEQVLELFPGSLAVGAQFGVVGVLDGEERIEVATFRSDGLYSDGRRPDDVCYSTDPREDVLRRDFTINGLLLDPASGEILDFVDGRKDLDRSVIRAIGTPKQRFEEDRLRMLRAVRFAASLDCNIEPQTFAAVRSLSGKITMVSAERVRDELLRILTSGRARRGFELLDESGLLAVVLPEIAAMRGVEQSPDYHPEGDVWEHTLRLLAGIDDLAPPRSESLALGALLHDVAKGPCAARDPRSGRITFYGHTELGETMSIEICQRLRRSRAVWERVGYLVRNHLRHTAARDMRRSTLRRFLSADGIEELLALARLDALASNGDLTSYQFCVEQREAIGVEQLVPPPLLRGRDLLELGWRPGPKLGEILKAVEERQLEGELSSRDEAVQWVERQFGAPRQ